MSKVTIPFEWNLKHIENINPYEHKLEFSVDDANWEKIKSITIYFKEPKASGLSFEVAGLENGNTCIVFTRGSKSKYFKLRNNKIARVSRLGVEITIVAIVEYYNGETSTYNDTKTIEIVFKDVAVFAVHSMGMVVLTVIEIDEQNNFLTVPPWKVGIKNTGNAISTFFGPMIQWQVFQDELMTTRIEQSPIEIIDVNPNEIEISPSDGIKEFAINGRFIQRPAYRQYFYVKLFTYDCETNYTAYKIIYDPSRVEVKASIKTEEKAIKLQREEKPIYEEKEQISEGKEEFVNLDKQLIVKKKKNQIVKEE